MSSSIKSIATAFRASSIKFRLKIASGSLLQGLQRERALNGLTPTSPSPQQLPTVANAARILHPPQKYVNTRVRSYRKISTRGGIRLGRIGSGRTETSTTESKYLYYKRIKMTVKNFFCKRFSIGISVILSQTREKKNSHKVRLKLRVPFYHVYPRRVGSHWARRSKNRLQLIFCTRFRWDALVQSDSVPNRTAQNFVPFRRNSLRQRFCADSSRL